MLVIKATADGAHLRPHRRAPGLELRHLAQEVVDSRYFRPGLRSQNPLRGLDLVRWSNQSHQSYRF